MTPKAQETQQKMSAAQLRRVSLEVDAALMGGPGRRLHCFLSGGGLRVARLETKGGALLGYGEHPYLEHALAHLASDYRAGGRSYQEAYGSMEDGVDGVYPHYLTGSSTPSSPLDAWVRRGCTFDAWREGGWAIAELKGYGHYETPKEIHERVAASGEPEEHEDGRGYTWRVERCRFANGEYGTSAGVVKKTEEAAAREKRSGSDALMWRERRLGRAANLHEAIKIALSAAPDPCE